VELMSTKRVRHLPVLENNIVGWDYLPLGDVVKAIIEKMQKILFNI
jgi:hypothetical protein